MVSQADALDRVVDFYLSSGDFNGLPVGEDEEIDGHLSALVAEGLIQVVSERDFVNPHIRPWASTGKRDQQDELMHALDGSLLACVYPTPRAMVGRDLAGYADTQATQPYLHALAAGAGALDLAFFELPAIEDYRNDPRYWFELDDFGVAWGIGDNAYFSDSEPERDKIPSIRAGFAYKRSDFDGTEPIRRFVCAFLRDLSKLTAAHQMRMKTWEDTGTEVDPHPTWYAQQMGEWTEYIGPFEKILGEMSALNDVFRISYGEPLFRKVERHRAWGWVLRAASPEWDQFVMLTDQLLSDNVNSKALDAMGAPTIGADGKPMASLNRLDGWFRKRTTASSDDITALIRPFKDVRKARQKPAHSAQPAVSDAQIVRRQRDMLTDLAVSLEKIRRFLAKSKKIKESGWKADDYLENWLRL